MANLKTIPVRNTTVVATRMPNEMYDRLAELAKRNFRSIAAEVLFAVNAHLSSHKNDARMQK
jgi:predicted DNA-binding protein